MISDPMTVFLLLSAAVLIAVQLEARLRLFRSLGAALTAILIGMLLSNTGVLPGESPAYAFLMDDGVNFGLVLILLSVDLRSILQAGPSMLAAFGIGALGTAVGAITGAFMFASLVGPETWKLAGQFTGTYTGGGANFAALGRDFDTSADLFSAATAADVIVTAVWMAACLAVPVILGRPKQVQTESSKSESGPVTLERKLHSSVNPISLGNVAALVLTAISVVWLSARLEELIPSVRQVLWLTTIVLILAQIPAVKTLSGSAMIGNYLILLFLASNGARSVIATLVAYGPPVFYYAIITVTIHGLVIFGVGRLARIDMPTLAVASQANIGGAASAIALAGARGYSDRILPGVAVGVLGYGVGNYMGSFVAWLMQPLLA